MLAVGVFALFAAQIVVNAAMTVGLLPVVGVTLPFFSSGGSSLLTSFLALGLVMSVGVDPPLDFGISVTELVTYEDLHISERGRAVYDVLDGFYDRKGGRVPCQVDGGLKCFGHPIGASGLRMLYEMYLQLHGRAGERQLADPRYGLTHNLGGVPFMNVCSIAIIGKYE